MDIEKISENAFKRLSKIGDRKYQKRFGEFLIEGVRFVEEALESDWEISEIAVIDHIERTERIKRILEKASARKIKIWRCNARQMKSISRTENNQGISAGMRLSTKLPGDIFGELLQKKGLTIALDAVQDPGNVGTIIRTADAFRAGGIILGRGCAGLFNPKTLRGTMGAIFSLPVAELPDREMMDIVEKFVEKGFQIISADNSQGAEDFEKINYAEKVLLIIGQEGAGVSKDILNISSNVVKIPISENIESLNAGVACGILCNHISRKLRLIK